MESMFLTYGRPVRSLEEVHLSYKDAASLLSRRFFCAQEQHAIGYEMLPTRSDTVYPAADWRNDGGEVQAPAPNNQRPRCKQRGIKLAALQSSGVFDPRGSRQMSASSHLARCSRE